MSDQISVDHHYVPKFLLRRWRLPNGLLNAYYWDERSKTLRTKQSGPGAFCNLPHLLSVPSAPGRPDSIEREFFGEVDDRGAKITARLIESGAIDHCDIDPLIEFVLSLEARRPPVVEAIRRYGPLKVAAMLNRDPELLSRLAAEGIDQTPAEYVAGTRELSLEDEALEVVKSLTSNSKIADALKSSNWMVRRLQPDSQALALGDRPLIRTSGLQSSFVWALPINPDTVITMAASPEVRLSLSQLSDKQFSMRVNSDSAMHSDKYVFWKPTAPTTWLARRLKVRAGEPRQAATDIGKNITM
jgi:hypothetical protein